ncbi:hypothetical protein LP420_02215 [Massilia sp. B-10]|nr:hypothetical protein LP420_02215 [Massilia sp. B-10]
MDLASHQRILLGLIRSNYEVGRDDDDYFQLVARSPDLEESAGISSCGACMCWSGPAC